MVLAPFSVWLRTFQVSNQLGAAQSQSTVAVMMHTTGKASVVTG